MAACAQVGSRPIRPLTSIILPPQQIDALVADAEKFQGSESWYGESRTQQEPFKLPSYGDKRRCGQERSENLTWVSHAMRRIVFLDLGMRGGLLREGWSRRTRNLSRH